VLAVSRPTKRKLENLVGFVKSSFFKVRRFHDEEDLRQQLQDWHHEVNEQRPCRATRIIPTLRPAEEASATTLANTQSRQTATSDPCAELDEDRS
jgi:hypothetical protein